MRKGPVTIKECRNCGIQFSVSHKRRSQSFCSRRCSTGKSHVEDVPCGVEGERFIPLTKGKFAKVDAADYDSLMRFDWHARWCLHTQSYYAQRQTRTPEGKRLAVQMGRHILGVSDRSIKVDHRNHDTLDFRRDNLRTATNVQNSQNRVLSKVPSSGYRGVVRSNKARRWSAVVTSNGVRHYLGSFATAKEASDVYEEKAKELHGDFYYKNGSFVLLSEQATSA